MNIEITKGQMAMLKPFFDEVRKAEDVDKPVSIMAQIHSTTDSLGYMKVTLIDHDTVLKIQEITGVEKGSHTIPGEEVTIYIPKP
jgi:hypothetical protein